MEKLKPCSCPARAPRRKKRGVRSEATIRPSSLELTEPISQAPIGPWRPRSTDRPFPAAIPSSSDPALPSPPAGPPSGRSCTAFVLRRRSPDTSSGELHGLSIPAAREQQPLTHRYTGTACTAHGFVIIVRRWHAPEASDTPPVAPCTSCALPHSWRAAAGVERPHRMRAVPITDRELAHRDSSSWTVVPATKVLVLCRFSELNTADRLGASRPQTCPDRSAGVRWLTAERTHFVIMHLGAPFVGCRAFARRRGNG